MKMTDAEIEYTVRRAEYAEKRALEIATQIGKLRGAGLSACLALYHARPIVSSLSGKLCNGILLEISEAIRQLELDHEIKMFANEEPK